MKKYALGFAAPALCAALLFATTAQAQIGRRFPSEKKDVIDPVTGVTLHFLTSAGGESKIYQTHRQWTADGKWLIFRSSRGDTGGQAFAVNEDSGVVVQVTEKGYMGMLCTARLSMKLYIMRAVGGMGRGPGANATPPPAAASAAPAPVPDAGGPPAAPGAPGARGPGGFMRPRGPFQVVEIDLAKLFADSEAGTMQPETAYDRICGTFPDGMTADGNMGLDANEDFIYCRVGGEEVAKLLPAGQKPAERFGPRGMGAGPTGLAGMNLKTGEVKHIVTVPFQIGHVQTNPWVPGEIVFCWETGGKAPQRTWTVMADGTGLRPLYPEADYEWITHEAVITKDEVALAIIALHKPVFPGMPPEEPRRSAPPPAADGSAPRPPRPQGDPTQTWGPAGGGDHPTGVAIINLRTREMRIVGQVPIGNPGRSVWHVNGSADGRWAAADDFQYRLWLIDRHTGEMIMLADLGHKMTAADHIHPTFNADGTKIEVQSAMLAKDGRALSICVVDVPKSWLARVYTDKVPE